MDEVLEKFEVTIGNETNQQKTNFDGLYKNWGRLGNQEERRKELLEVQKINRKNKVDRLRGIIDLVLSVEEDYQAKSYNRVHYRPSIYVAGFSKAPAYKDVLMLSEWIVEKPSDFEENWYVVPCPKGIRMLLVASRGITKFYTKYGQFRFEKRTALPGGNPCNPKEKMQCCVLDCFYVEKNNTVYVLDLLAWNNQTMTDCETEFRHFWLSSKFAECPDLKFTSKKNSIIFTLLPKTQCTRELFNQFMSTYPAFECNFPPLDGLLFYHKKAHYVNGETPLVGWLFPYMVSEIMGPEVPVHDSYFADKPEDYVNQADFIQKFEEKYSKRRFASRNRSRQSSEMEQMEVSKPTEAVTVDAESAETINCEPVSQIEQQAVVQMEEQSSGENSLAEKMAQDVLKTSDQL